MQSYSRSVALLEMFRAEQGRSIKGIGTGFFFRFGGKVFLVTNWHNLSGMNPETEKLLNLNGMIPDTIFLHCKRKFDHNGKDFMGSVGVQLPLYFEDRPIWFEHSTRLNVDVAAVEIPDELFGQLFNVPINDIPQETRLKVEAGLDCHIIGFPEGLVGPVTSPVWKRGSVATEPHPGIFTGLIDSATRPGMSGSPIVARHSGYISFNGPQSPDAIIGTIEKFIGIYAGRTGDDALGFQLGRFWRCEVLDDILTMATPGAHPLLSP